MARQLGPFGVAAQPARVQVGRQPVGPLDDLGVGVAAVALDDELPVADRAGDGVGGGGDGELHRGGGHRILSGLVRQQLDHQAACFG